jgi:hypothetical protein
VDFLEGITSIGFASEEGARTTFASKREEGTI